GAKAPVRLPISASIAATRPSSLPSTTLQPTTAALERTLFPVLNRHFTYGCPASFAVSYKPECCGVARYCGTSAPKASDAASTATPRLRAVILDTTFLSRPPFDNSGRDDIDG